MRYPLSFSRRLAVLALFPLFAGLAPAAVLMMQSPKQRAPYRGVLREMVYGATSR